MPIMKKEIKSDFTIVHNTFIRDANLSISARGMLLTMLSMSNEWNFSIKGLAAILPDGECKVSTALKELERYGYLVRNRICVKGKVVDWEYLISDEPLPVSQRKKSTAEPTIKLNTVASSQCEKPQLDFPNVDNSYMNTSHVENRHDYINNITFRNKKEVLSDKSINLSNHVTASQDRIDMIDEYTAIVKKNIEYDWFVDAYKNADLTHRPYGSVDELDGIVNIMVECICSSAPTIRVANQDMPQSAVKAQMLKINSDHIEYVFSCLEKNATKIHNIKAYLITALYNSISTMSSYISSDVRHLLTK